MARRLSQHGQDSLDTRAGPHSVAADRLANQRSALLGPNEVVALAAERYLQTEAADLVAVAKVLAEWPPLAVGRLRRTPRSLGLPRPHDWANTHALRRQARAC